MEVNIVSEIIVIINSINSKMERKSVAGVNVKSLDLFFRFAFIDKHFSLVLWEDGAIWTSALLKKTKARICSWSSSDRADLISD